MKFNSAAEIEEFAARRKAEIRASRDALKIEGTTYYVSADGDDNNDGKTPASAWKSIERVSRAELLEGDGVLFRRGDTFRGWLIASPGVTYAAYGEGKKPEFYASPRNAAEKDDWVQTKENKNVYKYCFNLAFVF